MLDAKVESFLAVCKNKSYTKAAEELCITQPAVTQHIKSLEKQYGYRFIEYSNRALRLTKYGELFYKYAKNVKLSEKVMKNKLKEINKKNKAIKFAATLTIGEFTIAPILGDLINHFREYDITMYVDNTQRVLSMLQKGEISFALVEGLFNKADYETKLLKNASFILITSKSHPLAVKDSILLHEIINETIIIREKGSGSREVFERSLFDKNYTLENFKNVIEIGNVNVIKEMVKNQIGLSFMYKDAAYKEIQNRELAEVKISDFVIEREFNFIYLKNNLVQTEVDMFFSYFKNKSLNYR
ncbi:LysR family transcriptional regulator [Clostridium formicaceticum]|uniref:HTH-type transcriptional regulator CysL n=1 Tax=Clostridium formicaceticum TaxID=1497 RepID=A0AAC9WGR8_9CLOT|nr:LysR family transcriptional regulator [Clostridium formicaceticum]AOY77685.1 hypothetical protein BJL90_18565 [Clostridium formicaceticum]ARE88272.1 HTH-type transcriptional regulator CysL [Clostridium formicaceticum]